MECLTGVIVNLRAKSGSAHDFRRSFGARWASKVKPAVSQALMRHSSIDLTMEFYADLEADELVADLWRDHGRRVMSD